MKEHIKQLPITFLGLVLGIFKAICVDHNTQLIIVVAFIVSLLTTATIGVVSGLVFYLIARVFVIEIGNQISFIGRCIRDKRL